MTSTSRRGLAAAATALVLAGATACTGDSEAGEPVEPFAVQLSPDGAPSDLKIGVVVTLAGAADQGPQWRDAAEGATVAAYRYQMGDVDVEILPRSDSGSEEGSDKAVQELVDEGVSGIVMATSGSHVEGGLQRAAAAGVPVVLPYAAGVGELPSGVWTTGPSDEQIGAALASGMETAGVSAPVLVDAGGGQPAGVQTDASFDFASGGDAAKVAARVEKRLRSDAGGDSVVVTGPAELQARVVQGLQEANLSVPVFLSGDAISPVFATTLAEERGSLSSPITTGGIANGDAQALGAGDDGAALSAYLAAVRVTAEDPEVTDFFDGDGFVTVADVADVASHDAVVSLVTAASRARSIDPGEVGDALGELQVDQSDGLGGPALDFSDAAALPEDEVVPLQASTQDPGLRTLDQGAPPRLFWFALPSS